MLEPMGPLAARALLGATLLMGATSAPTDQASDPWAPGVSAEPWALITSLQRPGSLGGDRALWRRAFTHTDPLVRAAAAWAAGRTQPPDAAALLGVSAFDGDQVVRDASLWALLNLDDAAARPLIWSVLATRQELTRAGASPTIRHLGEPPAGFGTLFRLRGLPLVEGSVAYRREWLQLVPPGAIEAAPAAALARSGVVWIDWTSERSEWDANERATIRADITMASALAGSNSNNGPQSLQLQTTLVALDEPDSGPGHWEEPVRLPVRLRCVASGDRDTLRLPPGAHATVDLQLSFSEIPPGPYALEPFGAGHPLLLRVRRSRSRENVVQASAAAARTPEEIDAISRQRVAAQADRWRGELATLLDTSGTIPAAHLRALARLHDGEAARLFIDAVTAAKFVRDGTGEITADHSFFRAFGDVALQHLEHAARGWRRALDARYPTTFIPSILTSRRLASAVLDDLRVAALAELAARVRPPPAAGQAIQPNEQQMRFLFVRTLVALAPRRPYEAGRALVAVADRPTILAEALGGFDQPSYTGYPYAADLDGVDATLLAAWSLLPVSAPADSRAAIATEAERLHIALRGMDSAKPTTAHEAVREMLRVMPRTGNSWPQPLDAAAETLRRLSATGLADQDARVAVTASRLAATLGDRPEALRLAEVAVRLTPSFPERSTSLLARANALQAAGDAVRARADLQEALPHLAGTSSEPDARIQLHALAGVPTRLRVRTWPPLGGPAGLDILTVDGEIWIILTRDHLVYRRDFVRGTLRLIGVSPWELRDVKAVDASSVVVRSRSGALALLREGQAGTVWRASVPASEDSSRLGRMVADKQTVLVRDSEGVVHAFDARTGHHRWAQQAAGSVPIELHGGDPVVLGLSDARHSGVSEIVGLDVYTGRVRWRVPVAAPLQAFRSGDGRAAWLLGNGSLNVGDLRTGRLRAEPVALPQPRGAQPGVAIGLVPRSSQEVVALSDRFLLVDGGRIAWSRDMPSVGQPWTPLHVAVGDDGTLWRVVAGNGPVVASAWTRDGDPIATYEVAKWGSEASVSVVSGHTVAIAVGASTVLLDRLPQ